SRDLNEHVIIVYFGEPRDKIKFAEYVCLWDQADIKAAATYSRKELATTILATCKHFETSFYGNFHTAAFNEPIRIEQNKICDGISPNGFRSLIKIMYGGNLDQVIAEENNNNSDDRQRIIYLLLDLLKGSDYYELVDTKKKIEIKLSKYVLPQTYNIIYETAKEYAATQLEGYCIAFKESNPDLFQD
ncbi:7178_t:CDS:2, partial [Entrophospora sp. SA101]